jgi:hypothetical protein
VTGHVTGTRGVTRAATRLVDALGAGAVALVAQVVEEHRVPRPRRDLEVQPAEALDQRSIFLTSGQYSTSGWYLANGQYMVSGHLLTSGHFLTSGLSNLMMSGHSLGKRAPRIVVN